MCNVKIIIQEKIEEWEKQFPGVCHSRISAVKYKHAEPDGQVESNGETEVDSRFPADTNYVCFLVTLSHKLSVYCKYMYLIGGRMREKWLSRAVSDSTRKRTMCGTRIDLT